MRIAKSAAGALAGLSCLALWTMPAQAQVRNTETVIRDPAQVERVLAALDNGYWIADGENADRQVYVLYSTACGFSKKLYSDTRALPNRPQLRWITVEAEGYGAEDVVSRRSTAAIGDAFNKKIKPPADPDAAKRALEINKALTFAVPNMKSIVYPTLIYRTQEGLRVNFGAPANLQRLTAAIPRPERAKYEPAALKWVAEPAPVAPSPKLKDWYAQENVVPMRVAPYTDAPVIQEIQKGYGFKVDGVAGGEWLRMPFMYIGNSPVYGYVHAAKEIKLANLQFTVKPMRGTYLSGNRTLELRSHPSLEADVLDVMEPGMQITKTGEVVLDGVKWTEVLLYTDGTKGYIKE